MKKQIVAFLLAVFLCLSMIPALAGAGNCVINGSFETVAASGLPASWRGTNCEIGTNCALVQADKDGANAFRMYGTNQILYQTVEIAPQEKYAFSVWVMGERGQSPAVKLEFSNENGFLSGENSVSLPHTISRGKKWENMQYDFKAPETATRVSILLRLVGDGDVTWDLCTLTGEVTQKAQEAIDKAEEKSQMQSDIESSGEEIEFLPNGGFEKLDQAGMPEKWSVNAGKPNEDIEVVHDAQEGNNALRLHGEDSIVLQQISGFVPGETYHLRAYLKEYAGQPAVIKIEFANQNGFYGEDDIYKTVKCTKKDTWEEQNVNFVVPVGAVSAAILFRKVGDGDIAWDNISLRGAKALVKAQNLGDGSENDTPVENAEELIRNGGFEAVNADGISPTGWQVFQREWANNAYVTLSSEKPHLGTYAVKIEKDDNTAPWVCQLVTGIQEGARYRLHAFINAELTSGTGAFKLEFYTNDTISQESSLTSTTTSSFTSTGGVWCEYTASFRVPEGARSVAIYPRMFGKGLVYFDDVSLVMTDYPIAFELESDEIFYYSDRTDDAKVSVSVAKKYYPELMTGEVAFTLLKEDTVLANGTGTIGADGTCIWTFPIALLSEKKTEYTVSATVTNQNSAQSYTYTTPVYKYDRPTCINERGEYILEDGTVFEPVFMYHADPADYPALKEKGVNVVQSYFKTMNSKDALDYAAANGMKVMYALYENMLPAGNPANREKAKTIINTYKNHPAVFAWMIMDEPYMHDPEALPDLIESYKLIRELDPVHPAYLLEAPSVPEKYKYAAKCTDIFVMDPYPGAGYLGATTTMVSDYVQLAREAAHAGKPIYAALQTFAYPSAYFPTVADFRSYMYQAYFEGVDGIGFYCYEEATADKQNLPATELWDAIGSFELEFCRDAFVRGRYYNFNEVRGEDAWWRIFEKDGKLYLAVLNRKDNYIYDKKTVTSVPRDDAETRVSIPLSNFDGTIVVSGYDVRLIGGDASYEKGSDAITVDLPPAGTALFEITPTLPVDESLLSASRYVDLASYPWARRQIESLRERDIVNDITYNTYAPGAKITRGDFAMFLIRTLGLSSDSTALFADVSADAYYAKEIATGKALGILKGVGDNLYNPNAEISRQDLMVICARGMRKVREMAEENTDMLTQFSDGDKVAAYALLDVASMIRQNIVKGNADGTLNPTGNTTRAEAAVIMYRISAWSEDP